MDAGLFVTGESLLNDRQDGMVERITRQSKKHSLECSITPSTVTAKDKRQTPKRKMSPKDEFNPYVKMMRLGPKQMSNVLAYDTDEDRDQRDEAYEDTSDTEEMTREVMKIPTSNSILQEEKSESDINSSSKSVETTNKAVSCGKTVISKMSKEKLVIKIAPLAKASVEMPASSGKTAAAKRKLKEKLVLEVASVSKASTKVTNSSDKSGLDKVKSNVFAVTASSEVSALSDMVTSEPNEKLNVSVAPMAKTSNEISVPKNNVKKLALFWEDFTVKAKVKASEPKKVSQETSAAVTNLELVAQPDSTTTDQETAQLPMDVSGASVTQSEHESDSVSNQSCKTPTKTPNKKTMPGTPKSPKEVLQDYTKTVQIVKSKSPVTSKSSKSSKGLDVTEESPGKWGKKSFRKLFPDPLTAESSPEVLESQTPKKKRSGKKRSLMSLNPAVYSQFFSPPPNEASLDSSTEVGNSSVQARKSVDDESFVISEVSVEEPIGGASCNDSLIGLSVDVSSAISNTSKMDSSVLDNSTVKRAISEVVTGVLGDDTSVAVTDSSAADECHGTGKRKKTVSISPDMDNSVDSPDLDSSSDDPPPLYPAINTDDLLPPALSPHPPVLEKLNMPQGENLSKDDASSSEMPDLLSPLNSLKPPILSPHPAGVEILKKTNPDKQVISKSSIHSQVVIQERQHAVGESGMRDKTTPVDIPVLAPLPTYDTTCNTDRGPVETAMDLTCYENHDKENIPTSGQSQEDTVSQPLTSQNINQASSDSVLHSEPSETESQFSPSCLSTSQLLWSPTPVLDGSPQPQVLTNRKSVKRPRKLVFDDVLNQEESRPDLKKLKSAELGKPDKPKRKSIVSKTSSTGKLALILSPTKTRATQPTLLTNSSTCAVTSPVYCPPASHQVAASAGPLSSTPVTQTVQRRIYEPKSAQPAPSATSTPLVQSSQRKLCEPSAKPPPSATSAPSIKTFHRRIYEPKNSRPAATSGSSRMTESCNSIAEQTDQVFFGASFKPTVTSERNSSVFWKQCTMESLADMKTANSEVDTQSVKTTSILDSRITPEGADNVRRHMKSSSTVHSQKSSTVRQQPLQTSTPISSQNSRISGYVQENRPVTAVVRVNAPVSTYQLANQYQNIVPVASQQVKTSLSTFQQTSQNQNRPQRANTPTVVYQYGSQVSTMVQQITASASTFQRTSQVPIGSSQQVNAPGSSFKHASQVSSTSQGSIQARQAASQSNQHKEQHQTKTFSLFDHVTNFVQERLSKQLKQRQMLLYNDVVMTDMRSQRENISRAQTENVPSAGSVCSGSSQSNYTTGQTDSNPQFQQNYYPRMSLEDSPDVQPQGHSTEGTAATALNFNQNLWQSHSQASPFFYQSSVCSRMQNLKPYTISGWISPSYLQALMQKTDLLNDMFSNALDHKGDVEDWVVENCRKSSPAVLARDLVFRIITLGKLERAVMLYNNMNCLPRTKMAAIRRCIQKQFPKEFDETIWRKKCLPYVKASVKVLLKHRVPQIQKFWLMNESTSV